MAFVATVLEDRFDVAAENDGCTRGGREFGVVCRSYYRRRIQPSQATEAYRGCPQPQHVRQQLQKERRRGSQFPRALRLGTPAPGRIAFTFPAQYINRGSTFDPCTGVWRREAQQLPTRR